MARFTADDPEGEPIVWSLEGDDMDEFTIVNGVLRFKSSPDFEEPQGGTSDNSTTYASNGSGIRWRRRHARYGRT